MVGEGETALFCTILVQSRIVIASGMYFTYYVVRVPRRVRPSKWSSKTYPRHSSSTVGWRIIGRARADKLGRRDSVVNGLQTRIPVDQAAIEQSKILKFRIELRNLGAKDLLLNVRTRSREGGRQYLIRGAQSR